MTYEKCPKCGTLVPFALMVKGKLRCQKCKHKFKPTGKQVSQEKIG